MGTAAYMAPEQAPAKLRHWTRVVTCLGWGDLVRDSDRQAAVYRADLHG